MNYTNNAFPIPILFCLIAFIGCFGMYGVSVWLQDIEALNVLGKMTLPVLVMHKFPIVLFQIVGPFKLLLKEPDSLRGFFFGGIPVTLISILMSCMAGKIIKKYFPPLLGLEKQR